MFYTGEELRITAEPHTQQGQARSFIHTGRTTEREPFATWDATWDTTRDATREATWDAAPVLERTGGVNLLRSGRFLRASIFLYSGPSVCLSVCPSVCMSVSPFLVVSVSSPSHFN